MDIMDDAEVQPSWADQVEGETLQEPCEEFDERKGIKRITDYKTNDEGQKVKVVRTYKIEVRKVSKSIARRKAWKKFGGASGDPPGPNPANTVISEEIFMQFVHGKDHDQQEQEDDPLAKLKNTKMVSCRICKGDHWTTRCPYKDTLSTFKDALDGDKPKPPGGNEESIIVQSQQKTGNKYVAPHMRGGAGGEKPRGEFMQNRSRDELATIRVTNLSEDTRESDLQELFRPFGSIARIYLAKDKVTGQSKGFAFINFYNREDAARAIAGVSGFGYDHLILNVEWAKPSGNQ